VIAHTISDKNILSHVADCYGYFVTHNAALSGALSAELEELQRSYYPDLHTWLAATQFTGILFETRALPIIKEGKLVHAIFVGIGEGGKHGIEAYRRSLAKLIRLAINYSAESLAITLPNPELFGVGYSYLARETASIATMTNYCFDEFITIKEKNTALSGIIVGGVRAADRDAIAEGLTNGFCIGHAINRARHWIDLPPSNLTPPELAIKAQEIAKCGDLGITVFSEEEVNKMGMGGLGGVSRGSDLDCHLVVMEYRTTRAARENAQTIAFVGKGITFDSGGLSLKPAGSMETMKDDMSGAAAVIAAMGAIAQLKPDVNVIGVTALAENLPSGTALMPGDIIRFYNGKTAEVRNTDAEGRLILADALAYTVKHYKPDAIIDVATLTGACPIALGPFFSAVMSQHKDLVQLIYRASDMSGDRVWELPLDDDFRTSVRSSVADMANTTDRKYGAGTICAAFFLQHFVGDIPWAHIDIAGTAYDVPDLPYYRPGATGAGVRLLIELASLWPC